MGVRWYLTVVSMCIFLTISHTERLFKCLSAHLFIFFGEVSVQILCPFFSLFFFCRAGVLDMNPLSERRSANISSRSVGRLFILSAVPSGEHKFAVLL